MIGKHEGIQVDSIRSFDLQSDWIFNHVGSVEKTDVVLEGISELLIVEFPDLIVLRVDRASDLRSVSNERGFRNRDPIQRHIIRTRQLREDRATLFIGFVREEFRSHEIDLHRIQVHRSSVHSMVVKELRIFNLSQAN